jgi:hypothetical protein
MPLATAEVVDGLDRLRKACTAGLACQVPAWSLSISTPVHGKTEEIEISRTLAASLIEWRPPEVNQTGLFGMKAQMVFLTPLIQDILYPLGIIHALEANDKVVTVADQRSFTP